MRDKQLYKQIMGNHAPWEVTDVALSVEAGEVTVTVAQEAGTQQQCPHCGTHFSGYDQRHRKRRHMDTCQFKTILVAEVPWVKCPEHGVATVKAPGSGFTALYEALVIDWLKEASLQAVIRRLSLSWNAIDGIMCRAVNRGLTRRKAETPKHPNTQTPKHPNALGSMRPHFARDTIT